MGGGRPFVAVTDAFASSVKENVRVPLVPLSIAFAVCLVALQSRVVSLLVSMVLLMSRPQLDGRGSWIVFLTDAFELSTCIVWIEAVSIIRVLTARVKDHNYYNQLNWLRI